MNLSLYVDRLRHELSVAADAGGDEARALADRLTAPLDSAARLILLEALSAAADEITLELPSGSVEVRLRGGDPSFVVTPGPDDTTFPELRPASVQGAVGDNVEIGDEGTSRLNLRLPEGLKARIEDAARTEGLSLNAWLVRAAASALGPTNPSNRSYSAGGERYTGWVR